jgi:hypothetical protein
MTSTLPTVTSGVVCGKCSHWADGRKVQVRHASSTAVRLCHQGNVKAAAHFDRMENHVVRIENLPPVPTVKVPTVDGYGTPHVVRVPSVNDETPDPEKVVPAGRYAIKGTDGQFKFYVIDHGRKGTKWEGRVFVSVQASDELHPVRNRDQRVGILAAIMTVGPLEASKAYGRELGICGVCRRTLTDPESIANGIGPVCAGKL